MAGDWGIKAIGRADLKVIAVELKRVDETKEITRLLRRNLRAAVKPMVPAVRAAALAIPAHGPASTGLRGRLAKATRVQVSLTPRKVGVSILVDPKKMGPGEKNLPAYMEGMPVGRKGDTRWRHPVFGHSDRRWASQDSHPFFYDTLRSLAPRSAAAVKAALDEVTAQISGKV